MYDFLVFYSKVSMIPPRWINCPPIGDMILDTFIPFKTPLNDSYVRFLDESQIFDVETLASYTESYQLGMVVDLTKTRRYYNQKEVEVRNWKYMKINCKGNEETPTEDQVAYFINIVRRFQNFDKLRKIGVHCTHGFNRTGFMICAYLVEELQYR
ncbi:unnamed protein product [Protopolystoma xenopodis]|uniref:Tyrosine specific protein phosphatases domain-containing protein n=1 Tax=Protopolystoma xenopodis TaxID=117903 RepID=A0A448XS93_9PLAT|nr:unnamed protein product [Protopolystoma xenopodis]